METIHHDPLRKQGFGLVIGLIVQYAIGMYVNFFVSFPEGAQPPQLWEFSQTQIFVVLHILIGLLLLIGSIVFLIRSLRRNSQPWKKPALLGFLGIILAAIAGSAFVSTQNDLFSYVMSLAFLLSFFSYAWGLARKHN